MSYHFGRYFSISSLDHWNMRTEVHFTEQLSVHLSLSVACVHVSGFISVNLPHTGLEGWGEVCLG